MLQPNTVSASTRAIELFRQNGGILRMADIVRGGITRNTVRHGTFFPSSPTFLA